MHYKRRMQNDIRRLLRSHDLRDTQARRSVLEALTQRRSPFTQKELHSDIKKQGIAINLVTIYRILETFEGLGIVHRHPSTGGFTLCSMREHKGHHGFLSCEKCGTVQEFADTKLCGEENRIASQAGFVPKHHVSEIIGLCSRCT